MASNVERKIVLDVETGLHKPSGLAKITIPSSLLKNMEEYCDDSIFKLSIHDIGIDLFFEYKAGGKVEIVSKVITHGRHKISITPYSTYDFINEFNEKIGKKFDIRLHINEEKLILEVNGGRLSTSSWRFYKETGGGVAIKAEYSSSQRRTKKLFIKYQMKFGEASVYLLEPQGERRRLSTQKIVGIEYDDRRGLILFRYKHGDRIKTTSADIYPKPKIRKQRRDEQVKLIWRQDECEVVIRSKLRRGRDYELIIPWRVFKELKSKYKTNIFKLNIKREDKVIEYIWKLIRKGEQEISVKGLTKGTYKVSIKPYHVKDFINEFNRRAKDKYGVELGIEDDVLTLHIGEKTLKTVKWVFDKEFGGGACIKAIYPSITKASREIIIKYQVKRGEVNIWILEPRRERRAAVYPIEKIVDGEDRIDIIYKHGKRIKTTYIPLPT